MITKDRATQIIESFKNRKIAVIGDIILDRYLWGEVERISPEAPVPVVDIKRETYNLGGASNVAWNLAALGVDTKIVGVVGDDNNGRLIGNLLKEKNIDPFLAVDTERPTTEKARVIAVSQQLLRIDKESKKELPQQVKETLKKYIRELSEEVDGFVISDYGKGVVSEDIVKICVDTSKPVFVDPKPKNFPFYKNVTIITPNKKEAYESIKASYDTSLEEVGNRIIESLSIPQLLITLGGEGMALFEAGYVKRIPAKAKKVYDVTGAGDTVIAVLAASRLSGGSFEESATLANYAAGYVVGEIGTAVVTTDIILEML